MHYADYLTAAASSTAAELIATHITDQVVGTTWETDMGTDADHAIITRPDGHTMNIEVHPPRTVNPPTIIADTYNPDQAETGRLTTRPYTSTTLAYVLNTLTTWATN